LSIKRNLPLLFTWYDNIEMKIPNTTNLIDGHFSQLKRMLRSHNGLKRERHNKLVIGFFEASKGITQ
ncbi:MAG: transposase, partial [Bacteroidales bacterium]|nr:transposase [Bacteroidales bacterium]